MKFGKHLAAEAGRCQYGQYFFNYHAAKQALKADVSGNDASGSTVQGVVEKELHRVSQFYKQTIDKLEAEFENLVDAPQLPEALNQLQKEVHELTRFAALTYVAVVKIIKKRNRHLRETYGTAANTSMHALDLLVGEVFFTSPRLANLQTKLELRAKAGLSKQVKKQPAAASQLLEDYTCPVCLDVLHNPVVLTCAHRFCWGCIVAHCSHATSTPASSTSSANNSAPHSTDSKKEQAAPAPRRLMDALQEEELGTPSFYPCPVCRKPQMRDIDGLQVDTSLETFISSLQQVSISAAGTATATTSPREVAEEGVQGSAATAVAHKGHALGGVERVASPDVDAEGALIPWGVIPPPAPCFKGKLCALLDLDGTLASSFTPKRAPRLPAYMKTHIVGKGSKLNPQGVFVVERPGLGKFLSELAKFAEVVVYTAGLEDYAGPIIDAIDPRGHISTRIYRDGCIKTEYYQCVKDMARLNRDLARTVLVDDTPLAFLHQPDNGVPVLGFRGDPDDQLLSEAVLPMLQTLAREGDVRPFLRKRFEMLGWFKKHGLPAEKLAEQALVAAAEEREAHRKAALTSSTSPKSVAKSAVRQLPAEVEVHPIAPPTKQYLLLTDFDKTLTESDTGERVMEALAPELLPMLVGLDPHESYIPITNTLLSELQRRGVSRDELLTTLQQLGSSPDFMPPSSLGMLQSCAKRNVDVRVLSDCNSLFIHHVLAGAKASHLIQDAITNPSAFEYVPPTPSSSCSDLQRCFSASSDAPSTMSSMTGSVSTISLQRISNVSGPSSATITPTASRAPSGCVSPQAVAAASARHKMVIKPRHAHTEHTCPLCPNNLCKGTEVLALRTQGTYQTIIYAGDGHNDICPTLALGPSDVVLARRGYPLAHFLENAQRGLPGTRRPRCAVGFWSTHEELRTHVYRIITRR